MDSTVVEIPQYRVFCATWGSFQPESGLPEIGQTARNATALTTALGEIGALRGEPHCIHDLKASESIDAFDAFLAKPGDDMIIYLASHGLVAQGASTYFRLAAADTKSPGDMSRAVAIGELIDRLTRRGGRGRKLMIIDACYSGKAAATLLSGPAVDIDLPSDMCVLFATNPFEAAQAPSGDPLTAFTGDLAATLATGVKERGPMLSVRSIYSTLRAAAKNTDVPEPWLIATGSSAESVAFRNLAEGSAGNSDGDVLAEQLAEFDHRAEILYVEDEADLQDKFRSVLERAGHAVTLASDPIEGHQALKTGHFDIVVIDLLLHGDSPATEFIQLCAEEAQDSLHFLVSRETKGSLDNWKHLGAIFQYPSRISTFLWKPEYTKTIKQHANQIRAKRRYVLSHVTGLSEGVNLAAERMIARNSDLEGQSERLHLEVRTCVERLVERWFPEEDDEHVYIQQMRMEQADSGRSANSIFTLIPALAGLEAQSTTPLILKLGPREEISQEIERYDRYVEVGVPLDFRTDKIASALTGNVGGIVYSFRGTDDNLIKNLADLGPEDIERCFDTLFGKGSPKRWYASFATGAGVSPTEHFAKLGFRPERFSSAWEDMKRSLAKCVEGLPLDSPARKDELTGAHEEMSDEQDATLVHGDLTLENLVKISDERYAIIDYRTVGLGPRLVDFATLEIACWLLACAPEHASRSERFADAYPAVPRRLSPGPPGDEIADWLRTPAHLARRCRELAVQNHRDAGSEEYGSLLWLAALRTSEFRSRAQTTPEQNTQKVMLPAIALAAQELILAERK